MSHQHQTFNLDVDGAREIDEYQHQYSFHPGGTGGRGGQGGIHGGDGGAGYGPTLNFEAGTINIVMTLGIKKAEINIPRRNFLDWFRLSISFYDSKLFWRSGRREQVNGCWPIHAFKRGKMDLGRHFGAAEFMCRFASSSYPVLINQKCTAGAGKTVLASVHSYTE
jgi:hypothetical protein